MASDRDGDEIGDRPVDRPLIPESKQSSPIQVAKIDPYGQIPFRKLPKCSRLSELTEEFWFFSLALPQLFLPWDDSFLLDVFLERQEFSFYRHLGSEPFFSQLPYPVNCTLYAVRREDAEHTLAHISSIKMADRERGILYGLAYQKHKITDPLYLELKRHEPLSSVPPTLSVCVFAAACPNVVVASRVVGGGLRPIKMLSDGTLELFTQAWFADHNPEWAVEDATKRMGEVAERAEQSSESCDSKTSHPAPGGGKTD